MQTPYTVLDRARNRSSWANSNTQWILVQIQKSVLKWLFLWTSPSLFKTTFKHLSFSSVYVQTVKASFKHWPWNRNMNFVFYCQYTAQVILFLQPEWKVYVITIPMYKRWERNNQILRSTGNKPCLYTQTLQHRLCSRAHTDIAIWIAFALRSASNFPARLFPYYKGCKGLPQLAIVPLSIQGQ